MKELEGQLRSARVRAFHSNLSGPQLVNARADLEALLGKKDFYMCLLDLITSANNDLKGPSAGFYHALRDLNRQQYANYDGGIPKIAESFYRLWSDKVRTQFIKNVETSSDVGDLVKTFPNALASDMPDYQRYVAARDWAEYSAGGQNLSNDPKEYVLDLILMGGPADLVAGVRGTESADASTTRYYESMVSLFGQDAIARAARAVMAAKKDHDGYLSPGLRADNAQYSSPWSGLWGAIGETSPRNYALAQSFFDKTDAGKNFPKDVPRVTAQYDQMIAWFGQDAVDKATVTIMNAKKGQSGSLVPMVEINGAPYELPLAAIWAAIGETSTRNYALTQNVLDQSDVRTLYPRDLQRVTGDYDQMVAWFGQDAIDKASRTVMSAKKDQNGYLSPAFETNGAKYRRPWAAIWAALGESGPRNYVITQSLLALGGISDFYPAELRKAASDYQQLVTAHGEVAVLRASKTVHDAAKHDDGTIGDPRVIGASNRVPRLAIIELLGAGGGATATSSDNSTAYLDNSPINPMYQAWVHFKVGAIAVYGEDYGTSRKDIFVSKLISIDAGGATIDDKFGNIDAESNAPYLPYGKPKTVLAHLTTTVPRAPPSAGNSEAASGTQMLKVNGKIFKCQWQRHGNLIVWRSDEVPGGVVLSHDHTYRILQPQITDLSQIHSIADIRFEVEALSDGPYGQSQTPIPPVKTPK
jgi:hypothetical protein